MPIQLGSSAALRFLSGSAYSLAGGLGAAVALAIGFEEYEKRGLTGSLATKMAALACQRHAAGVGSGEHIDPRDTRRLCRFADLAAPLRSAAGRSSRCRP